MRVGTASRSMCQPCRGRRRGKMRDVVPMDPHVVILGGGFGGLDAARTLAGAPVRITLIDRHNYHLFQPLLYQVATASLSPADIASPIRWILRHQKNVSVLLAAAHAVDVAGTSRARRSGRLHPLRLPDHRHRIGARLLRASRMGRARAGPQDARRCAGDPEAGAAGLRGGRARNGSGRPAPPVDVRRSSAAGRPASSLPARWRRSRGNR